MKPPPQKNTQMQKDKLNFAFWGTPEVAKKTLEFLLKSGYSPMIIITSPDAPSGRGMHLKESPVSEWAGEHGVTCLKPEKIDESFIENFKKYNVDISIVVAYGKILPEKIINSPRLGTINIHYSLLPRWRGASPLEASLLAGDEETGISIQQMVFKLDSGPIIIKNKISIDINDTKEYLREKLITLGGESLCQIIPKIQRGEIQPIIQDDSKATFCRKIKKEDGQIDPDGNHRENYNKYRAFYGWPGVYFFKNINGKDVRIKITKARYENNLFIIEKVIPESKKEISWQEFSSILK